LCLPVLVQSWALVMVLESALKKWWSLGLARSRQLQSLAEILMELGLDWRRLHLMQSKLHWREQLVPIEYISVDQDVLVPRLLTLPLLQPSHQSVPV
jgi:hypothetical protein